MNNKSLQIYVATNEKIIPLLKLLSFQETKLHIGDLMIVQKITGIPTESEQICSQMTYQNLPQLKASTEYFLKPLVLIERKSISDFCNSLSSKHKKEQNLRMLQFRQNLPCPVRLFFVIEGYLQLRDLDQTCICGHSKNDIESAFAKLTLRDQIHVQQVYNIQDHCEWLQTIVRILTNEADLIQIDADRNLEQEYRHQAIKIAKIENKNADSIYQMQLTCIPKVSPIRAEVIAKQYGSFRALIESFQAHECPETMLAGLQVPRNDGSTFQSLGPKLAEEIYKFLMK